MATPPADRRDRHVVALAWGQFLEWMRDAWPPGAHAALIGPTGEGKTTAAIGLLTLRRWVIALDAKGMDDTLSASGYERIREWPPPARIRNAIAEGYPARLIVGGPSRTAAETRQLEQTLRAAVEGVRAEGSWCIYADELQILSDRRMAGVTTEIEELLISARTRGTSVLTSTQSPNWVPRAATRQASVVMVWGTRDRDSLKKIAESMGRPWRELEAMVAELEQYTVLAIPKRIRDPLVLTRAPAVN